MLLDAYHLNPITHFNFEVQFAVYVFFQMILLGFQEKRSSSFIDHTGPTAEVLTKLHYSTTCMVCLCLRFQESNADKQIPSVSYIWTNEVPRHLMYCSGPLVFHVATEFSDWTFVWRRGRFWWIQGDSKQCRYCSCLRKSNRTNILENRLIHSISAYFFNWQLPCWFWCRCAILPQHQVSKWTVGDHLNRLIDISHR